ncbi:kanadaptin [Musca vetustissima]|uniref:kanadaptin n=1 Tax=Musca vetustissima TaxID=27455 RepID=UPI002AB6271E|nr:kanadaptin [Musca vetustissima]
MEEFKKPSLPVAPAKIEKPKEELKKPIAEDKTKVKDEAPKPQPATNKPPQTCPYKVPLWSKNPPNESSYSFEVLKSGQIIDGVKNLQTKAFWTFGRLPENDIEMAHPTISRFHAVLQYRPKKIETQTEENDDEDDETKEEDEKKEEAGDKGPPEGWYIYDLDSTHGTFLNKQRIPPKVYIRIRVGHMLRLGASTRSYILQGPPEDEEPESELTITELKEKRQRDLEAAALEKKRLAEEAAERERNEGCSWGMTDDADEETDLTHNPFAATNNEELFLDDPKKTLRGYFEREGLELEYKCDEMSAGSYVCRVELPLDDDNGRSIVAEVVHKGKKKECVVQCALEACRILDRHGVLRQANQEPQKRKQKSKDSDSDDDEFWDRTGDVARKKQRRANTTANVTLTYDDLLKQEEELNKELQQVQANIVAYQEKKKQLKTQKEKEESNDDLDSYMENLQTKENPVDKIEIKKLRLEELRLKTEIQRNQRLLKIAKPVDLPFMRNPLEGHKNESAQGEVKKKQLPMIGKRNQFSKFKIVKPQESNKSSKPSAQLASDEEEVEEEEQSRTETKVVKEEPIKAESKVNIDEIFERNPEKKEDKPNLTKPSLDNDEEISETPSQQSPKVEKIVEKEPAIVKDDIVSETKPVEVIPDPASKEDRGATNTAASTESSKKRRQRNRQRTKREADMDDDIEYESSEKYAKWVPPENQTGDGITELNKKYGY